MKTYILCAGITASTLLSGPTLSDEITYGIGAAVNDSLKIYFPINTGNFLIEPSIVYFDNNNDTDSPQSFNTEDKTTQIGIGVFVKSAPVKNTYIYYGARVGYIKNESNSDFSGSQISKSKDDGYFIAPTIGAEYRVIDSFSIGLDLSLSYSKTDGSTNTSFNNFDSTFDTKNTTTRSAAEIIVRYYF
jgi:hypothetical protein